MKHYFTLIILFISIHSFAQQKTDFSGSWLINKDKTDFGDAPDWVLVKSYGVLQDAGHLTLNKVAVDDSAVEHKSTEVLLFNGTPTETTVMGTSKKRTVSLKWNADGKTLVITSSSISTDGKSGAKTTETWSLDDEGKTLVIDRTVEQGNGLKYAIKAYYDKQ